MTNTDITILCTHVFMLTRLILLCCTLHDKTSQGLRVKQTAEKCSKSQNYTAQKQNSQFCRSQ